MQVNSVMIEITRECNCNCGFCYNSSGNSMENMSCEQVEQLIEDLHKIGIIRIAISGGEPYLHPSIFKILEKAAFEKIKTTVLSNGLNINNKCLQQLVDNKEIFLQLSLDSAKEEINDEMRIQGHFKNSNQLMKTLYEKGFKNGYVKMTITNINKDGVDEIFFQGKKYGFIPIYAFVEKTGNANKNWEKYWIKENEKIEIIKRLNALYNENQQWLKKYISNSELIKMKRFYTNYCSLVKEDLIINPLIKVNGDVQICQKLYQKEYCIGNIYCNSLKEIFNDENKKIKRIIEIAKNRLNHLTNIKCADCLLNQVCGKGCLANSVNIGNINFLSEDCVIFKDTLLSKLEGK